MHCTPTPTLPEVMIIEPRIFEDDRGYLMEMYHQEKMSEAGIRERFVQDNRSLSRRGTIRGLHYQLGRPQGKLVWALQGEVFDVAVDIRRGSPNFGKWVGVTLTGENKRGLYIPADFAHGFCVVSETAEFFYKCTDFYSPEHERCIVWNDPDLAINWPMNMPPRLSEKDAGGLLFRNAEVYP